MYLAEQYEWAIERFLFRLHFVDGCCLRVAGSVPFGAGRERAGCAHIIAHHSVLFYQEPSVLVPLAAGSHLFPSRTQQLSPPAPMVVTLVVARVGRCRDSGLLIFMRDKPTVFLS